MRRVGKLWSVLGPLGRTVMVVLVLGLVGIGWALVSYLRTDQNPSLAVDLCQDTIASRNAASRSSVHFAPDPVVGRDGDSFFIGGGVDIGSQLGVSYDCEIKLTGDRLVVVSATTGG